MREPELQPEREGERQRLKVSSGRRTGCGSPSNAGFLKTDMFRIKTENVRTAEKEACKLLLL